MNTFHVSTAVDPGAELVFTDEGEVLDLEIVESLLPLYRVALTAHVAGKTTVQLTVAREEVLVGVGLMLAPHADPRRMLSVAYAQDAEALDTLARLSGSRDWFALCSGRTFLPQRYSPEHLGFLSVPDQASGLALLLTTADGSGLPQDVRHFRLYVLENGEDVSLYDSVFAPGSVTSYLPEAS